MHVGALFPNTKPQAVLGYNTQFFEPDSLILSPGQASWMQFTNADTLSLTGLSTTSLTHQLDEGWNLITGPECSVPMRVTDTDGVLIDGTLYGFAGVYQAATEVLSGQGYWIRAAQQGQIVIGCEDSIQGLGYTDTVAQSIGNGFETGIVSFDSLRVVDARGHARVLRLGDQLEQGFDPRSYSLPPLPDDAVADIRFADADYVHEWRWGDATAELHGMQFPIHVAWYGTESLRIQGLTDGTEHFVTLLAAGETMMVEDAQVAQLGLTIAQPGEDDVLKHEFQLAGHYPNPVTSHALIKYSLPEAARTEVHLFDIQGREVSRMVHEVQEAGAHTLPFDASGLASGLYMYVLQAGEHRATGKMLVVR